MASRERQRPRIIPVHLQTVCLMRQAGVEVIGACQRPSCRHVWTLDLARIEMVRGPHYCLWGRRLRCVLCRDPEAKMLAPGHGGRVSINAGGVAEEPAVRALWALCPWCGYSHRGYQGMGEPPH